MMFKKNENYTTHMKQNTTIEKQHRVTIQFVCSPVPKYLNKTCF